jgi:hypothetical protein
MPKLSNCGGTYLARPGKENQPAREPGLVKQILLPLDTSEPAKSLCHMAPTWPKTKRQYYVIQHGANRICQEHEH